MNSSKRSGAFVANSNRPRATDTDLDREDHARRNKPLVATVDGSCLPEMSLVGTFDALSVLRESASSDDPSLS